MTRHLYGLILLASFSFASTQSHSEVYRWVDDQGKVHFGDKAPDNKQAKEISTQLQKQNVDYSAPLTQQSLQQLKSRQQALSTESQQQTDPNAEQRDSICRNAKQRLRIIEGPVVFLDDNGEAIEVSEVQRQQRADALENQIKKNCS